MDSFCNSLVNSSFTYFPSKIHNPLCPAISSNFSHSLKKIPKFFPDDGVNKSFGWLCIEAIFFPLNSSSLNFSFTLSTLPILHLRIFSEIKSKKFTIS